MARNEKRNAEVEAPAEETPAVETPAVETSTETPAEGTTEAPAAEAPAVVDLTAAKAALAAAIEGADISTGDVAPGVVAPVADEYRKLDAKGKREFKKFIQEQLRESVMNRNMEQAKAFMTISDQLGEGGTKKAEATKTPVDPTEAFVSRAVSLRLAAKVFTATVPEGVKDEWRDQANELFAALDPQVAAYSEYLVAKANAAEGTEVAEPEGISDVVKAAFKVAQGKGVGAVKKASGGSAPRAAFEGTRRDIKKHILEAFAAEPDGKFLTVAEIRSFKSAEYGDDEPSSGAISARLFPPSGKCTVEGITPDTQDGKKGARKGA